jgi:hypothetical protein
MPVLVKFNADVVQNDPRNDTGKLNTVKGE